MKSLALAIAVLFLPIMASAQSDLDGNKMTTQVKVSYDGSTYSDGRNGYIGTLDVTQRVNDYIAVEGVANGGSYFGEKFGGGGGFIQWNPNKSSYVQAGGLRNSTTDTTQTWTASVEAGTLVQKGEGFIRATELDYNQTWRGFSIVPSLGVTTYTPRLIFYLPRGFDLALHAGVVDTINSGVHNMTPSGGGRLRIPVTRRIEFTASAGFDAEGMTNILAVRNLSTRNYGGGVKLWMNPTFSAEIQATNSQYTTNHLSGNIYSITLLKRFGTR